MQNHRLFGFVASTGRTATTLIAKLLSELQGVTALHEGHYLEDKKTPIIPPINMEHRRAWFDEEFRKQLVQGKRSAQVLDAVLDNTGQTRLIDVAYYNAALVKDLYTQHPQSRFVVIFRRCETFVRSATTMTGEDLMPVGWPDAGKELTSREKFIELGRLKPPKHTETFERWANWSAIQKNIWLWQLTNQFLWDFVQTSDPQRISLLHYEELSEHPSRFWGNLLKAFNLYNESSLEYCLNKSSKKENTKAGGYQIAAAESWSAAEKMDLQQALKLEKKIYDK